MPAPDLRRDKHPTQPGMRPASYLPATASAPSLTAAARPEKTKFPGWLPSFRRLDAALTACGSKAEETTAAAEETVAAEETEAVEETEAETEETEEVSEEETEEASEEETEAAEETEAETEETEAAEETQAQ